MNVLIYTTNSRYSPMPVGGAETSLELIAKKLVLLGHKISFVTLSSLYDDPASDVEDINGYTVYRIKPEKFTYPTYKTTSEELQQLKDDFKASQYQKKIDLVSRVLLQDEIDISYSYEIKDTMDVLEAKRQSGSNVKIVKRVAGLFWLHRYLIKKLSKETIINVFAAADAVNYLSDEAKELVLSKAESHEFSFIPQNEMVMDIGVDLELFKYRWEKTCEENQQKEFRIVCVAKFAPYQKMQDLLIKAIRDLDGCPVVVDFLGVGKSLEYCQDLCKSLGLEDRCFFHGYLSQQKVSEMLSKASLFVLPTKDEGLSKAHLEAMAIGVPCLVSNVAPLNRYIKDNVTGFLADNDPESWVKRIINIYQGKHDLMEVSKNARNLVETKYNADRNILKFQSEFQNLLSAVD